MKAVSDCLELSPQQSESLQEAVLGHLEILVTNKVIIFSLKNIDKFLANS